jgi:hypothetical protein
VYVAAFYERLNGVLDDLLPPDAAVAMALGGEQIGVDNA